MTSEDDIDWAEYHVMQGITTPADSRNRIRAFIGALRNLRGINRADVGIAMPWDCAHELRKLGDIVVDETADVSLLDNDEDFQYRLKHGPR